MGQTLFDRSRPILVNLRSIKRGAPHASLFILHPFPSLATVVDVCARLCFSHFHSQASFSFFLCWSLTPSAPLPLLLLLQPYHNGRKHFARYVGCFSPIPPHSCFFVFHSVYSRMDFSLCISRIALLLYSAFVFDFNSHAHFIVLRCMGSMQCRAVDDHSYMIISVPTTLL